MNNILYRIVSKDVKCRSLKSEILSGKKNLPFKYIFPYKDDPEVVKAYKDYMFQRCLNKYLFSN